MGKIAGFPFLRDSRQQCSRAPLAVASPTERIVLCRTVEMSPISTAKDS